MYCFFFLYSLLEFVRLWINNKPNLLVCKPHIELTVRMLWRLPLKLKRKSRRPSSQIQEPLSCRSHHLYLPSHLLTCSHSPSSALQCRYWLISTFPPLPDFFSCAYTLVLQPFVLPAFLTEPFQETLVCFHLRWTFTWRTQLKDQLMKVGESSAGRRDGCFPAGGGREGLLLSGGHYGQLFADSFAILTL